MQKLFFINFIFCDSAEKWQIGIQDPATTALEGMIYFHNYLLFFLIVIGVCVFWFLFKVIILFHLNNDKKALIFTHSNLLEIIWTILPAIILLFIAIPSFSLLYSLDELVNPVLTLKIIGHQWYWSYEITDYLQLENNEELCFDSYLLDVSNEILLKGRFRLLEVDNRVVLPTLTHIRLLITATDVLHSWAIPSFGIKVDACPGRLSESSLFIKRNGVFYGQCSEICGVNHGFMPIGIIAVDFSNNFNTSILSREMISTIDPLIAGLVTLGNELEDK